MNLPKKLFQWFEQRQAKLCHRQLLVITGQEQWTKNAAITLLGYCGIQDLLWVGDPETEYDNISVNSYRSKLGQEYECVVLDSFLGFRANAAMALSGTIKAQGLMVILCPKLSEWPNFDDPQKANRISFGNQAKSSESFFIQHLIASFGKDIGVAILSTDKFSGKAFFVEENIGKERYLEQHEAVKSICKVAQGHRNRPLVMTADRGRGKSSALGIAAAELMQASTKRICITAPHVQTVEQVFIHSKRLLPDAQLTSNSLTYGNSSLFFKPIDLLLKNDVKLDLLLVDEASAIPVHVLTNLAKKFSRIVFSSTTHGYEGSGRGFEMRFIEQLAILKPNFKRIHLSQPIRWYQHDLLEEFWFNTFFHHAQQSSKREQTVNAKISCRYISKAQLINDKQLLADIFGLLIDAHYQTSQDDLQRFLDAPEIHCFILTKGTNLLGVAQIIEEGGHSLVELADNIADCSRRVNGHLVAQNLTSSYNIPTFLLARQWRVSRIAITPEYQRKGHGKQLVKFVEHQAKQQGIKFLTASFGCNTNTLNFWYKNKYSLVKLSPKPEISSGEHSGICIKPLTSEASKTFVTIHQEFHQEFLFQVDKHFKDVCEEMLIQILLVEQNIDKESLLCERTLGQFAFGKRTYSSCKRMLKEYLIVNPKAFLKLETLEQRLLVAALLQNQTDKYLCGIFNLTGKKQIEQRIKSIFRKLF